MAIVVPETMQTMKELYALIQKEMRLERKMMFASSVYLPTGERLTKLSEFKAYAQQECAFIIGCGEPFDKHNVPASLVLAFQHGGGRHANNEIKKELMDKRKKAAHLKADQIRATGHGTNNSAVRQARQEAIEHNRQQAAVLRHMHMTNMLQRAAEQEAVVKTVRDLNMSQREEERYRAQRAAEQREGRVNEIASQRRKSATHRLFAVQLQQKELSASKASVTKEVRTKEKEGLSVAKHAQEEASRTRGAQRRMSSAARAVKRAELVELENIAKKASHDRVAANEVTAHKL